MAYEIERAMERLKWEMKKDEEQTNLHKQKLIEEIKSYNKSEIIASITGRTITSSQKKKSFFRKFLLVLGYGKKR